MKGTVVLWDEELLSRPAFPNSVFFGKAKAFLEFFPPQAELERDWFLSQSLAGIFVAVWLNSCSSLLGTLTRNS